MTLPPCLDGRSPTIGDRSSIIQARPGSRRIRNRMRLFPRQMCRRADRVSELGQGDRTQRSPKDHLEHTGVVLEHKPYGVPRNTGASVRACRARPHPIPSNTSLAQRPVAVPAQAMPAGPHHADERLPEVLAQDRVHECRVSTAPVPPNKVARILRGCDTSPDGFHSPEPAPTCSESRIARGTFREMFELVSMCGSTRTSLRVRVLRV